MHQRQRVPLPQLRVEGPLQGIQKVHRRCRQVHHDVLEQAAAPRSWRCCAHCLLLLLLRCLGCGRLRWLSFSRLLFLLMLLLLLLLLSVLLRLLLLARLRLWSRGRHYRRRCPHVQLAGSCQAHELAAVHVEWQHLAAHAVDLDVGAQVGVAGGVEVICIDLTRGRMKNDERLSLLAMCRSMGAWEHGSMGARPC